MSTTEPGDLIAVEYQYEFRNLLFGSGTDYVTTKVSGLHALPPVRNSDVDYVLEHGAQPGPVTMGKRTISIDMTIKGAAGQDIEDKISSASAAFQLPSRRNSRRTEKFVFWRPGQVKKFINVRCERRDFPSDFETARGMCKGTVDLVAPDPLVYSLQEHTKTLTLGTGETSGQINIPNFGNHQDGAACILEVTGPATNFSITNSTDDNRSLQTNASLDADDVFIHDQAPFITTLNGDDGADFVENDSQEWRLLPGENVLVFSRSGTNAAAPATLKVTWRDVWQ